METWTGIKGRSHSLCGKENRCLLAADGCEAGFQIGKDIINVLGADGQADGVLVDLLLGQLGIGQLAVVVEAGWMTRLFTSATLASREKIFRLSMKVKASSRPPLMLKVKMDAPPLGKYFWYRA